MGKLKDNVSEPYQYDPVRDLQPVDQIGFVDLRDAFVNHTVDSNLNVTDLDYNGVDDPSSLLARPTDRFDAIRKAQYVADGISKQRAEVSGGVTEGTPPSSAANE